MNAQSQRVCAWTGIVSIAIWMTGFVFVAGFVPPPSPSRSAELTRQFFIDNQFSIRLGLMMTMGGAALLLPWIAVLGVQMRRIEGTFSPYTYTQLAAGAVLPLEFIFPVFFWQVAAYRPEENDAKTVQMLNDMGWLPFVGLVGTAVVAALALGLVILRDHSGAPIFPRWSGYFSVWAALMFCPAGCIVFFKSGPFAWSGMIGFWVIFISFPAWMIVFTGLMLKAITAQERAETTSLAPAEPVPAS
jgi:hypothetical protein